MSPQVVEIKRKPEKSFIDKVKELLPDEGNLNLCLTCGLCASGCPASGLENMDPRKFLRMAAWEWMKSSWNPNGPGGAPCACGVSSPAP